jgi:hypothetical protein
LRERPDLEAAGLHFNWRFGLESACLARHTDQKPLALIRIDPLPAQRIDPVT